MDNMDYKSNSHKSKEAKIDNEVEKKRAEKVVSGEVKTKKKNELASVIIAEDVRSVGSYLITDVAIPKLKDFIVDIVSDGISMLFKGTAGRKSSNVNASYVSYNKPSLAKSTTSYNDISARSRYSYEEIILVNRADAEEVLDRMDELLEQYGVVRVADLYDLVGKSCDYTDNKYRWTNLRSADVVRVNGGYALKLPKALPID